MQFAQLLQRSATILFREPSRFGPQLPLNWTATPDTPTPRFIVPCVVSLARSACAAVGALSMFMPMTEQLCAGVKDGEVKWDVRQSRASPFIDSWFCNFQSRKSPNDHFSL